MNDDLEIPMFAEDEKALQEQKRKRNEHWLRMRRARDLWFEETGQTSTSVNSGFWLWLASTYGIVPDRDQSGNITEGIVIVDEKLYTLFLLKFSQ